MLLTRIMGINFKQHEHIDKRLTPGLNLVIGDNEAGKSNFMAILFYNWFGAKLLDEPVKEVVTRGKPLNSMRTLTEFALNGAEYHCTRSPAGAELKIAGEEKPLVTGHNEVTDRLCALFGLAKEDASYLLVAKQDELRGVLEKGDTAAAQFIEKLANFSQTDKFMQEFSARHKTGVVKPFEEVLEKTKAELQEPQRADTLDLDAAYSEAEAILKELEIRKQELLADLEDSAPILQRAIAEESDRAANKATMASVQKSLETARATIANPPAEITEEQVKNAKEAVDQLQQAQQYDKAERALKLIQLPPQEWEGGLATFQQELTEVTRKAQALTSSKDTLANTIRQLRASAKATSCDKCGQSIENAEEHNRHVQEEVKRKTDQLSTVSAEETQTRQYAEVLEAINKAYAAQCTWINTFGDIAEVNDNFIPHVIKLAKKPGVPWDPTTYSAAVKNLEDLTAARSQYLASIQLVSKLRTDVREKEEQLLDLQAKCSAPPRFDKKRIEEERADKEKMKADVQRAIDASKDKMTKINTELQVLETAYKEQVKAYKQGQENIKKLDRELQDIRDNNLIMSVMKEARKTITNEMWNGIMALVSEMFSRVRSVPTTVTRDETGFKANDIKYRSLSGSTKDVLGLVVRNALGITFMPHLGIQCLDEPARGCSAARADALLGLITSSGFEQTIMGTHRKDDEAVADNIITIGE